jgi:hypothetical protein
VRDTLPAVTRPALGTWFAALALVSAACGLPPAPDDASADAAVRLVMSAERAMGGSDPLAKIHSIVAEAQCRGPDGDFTTRVATLLPDSVRFIQRRPDRPPLEILVVGDRGWRFPPETGPRPIEEPLRAMVRGRELHAMVVRMLERFPQLRRSGEAPFAGQSCLVLEGTDLTGRPATVYLRSEDALPAGFRLADPLAPDGEPIVVDLADWRQVGDVRLFHQATFTTRAGLTRWVYTTLSLTLDDPSSFVPPE